MMLMKMTMKMTMMRRKRKGRRRMRRRRRRRGRRRRRRSRRKRMATVAHAVPACLTAVASTKYLYIKLYAPTDSTVLKRERLRLDVAEETIVDSQPSNRGPKTS